MPINPIPIECYALCIKTSCDDAEDSIGRYLKSQNIEFKLVNHSVNQDWTYFDVIVWGPGIIAMHNIAVAMRYMKNISIELNLFGATPNGSLGDWIRKL